MFKNIIAKNARAERRANRTRARVRGTAERPRLTVFRSLKHTYAQLIDDTKGLTLAASSDRHVASAGKKPLEVATLIGTDIATKAKAAGITTVVFDRGSYRYHGRVAAIADAARAVGLVF